jgi:hypothetical protein
MIAMAGKGRAKKTHEEFMSEVYSLVGDEYSILGEYQSSHSKITFKHNKCQSEYEVSPSNFLSGKRCPSCFGRRTKKTGEDFKRFVEETVGNEYTVVGKYKNASSKIEIRHNTCGNEYLVEPRKFRVGKRCFSCANKQNGLNRIEAHTNIFIDNVRSMVGDDYTVLGEYKGRSNKILMKHNECSSKYSVEPRKFLEGIRCPNCCLSKGETMIERVLRDNNIERIREYKFEDCVYRNKLPFDFAIINNEKVTLLIEYDGIQHFEPVAFYGGEKTFKLVQKRDAIKNKYCKENKIPLIRVPYTMDEDMIKIVIEDKLREIS